MSQHNINVGVSFSVQEEENLSITAIRVGSCSCSSASSYMAELRVVERRCIVEKVVSLRPCSSVVRLPLPLALPTRSYDECPS